MFSSSKLCEKLPFGKNVTWLVLAAKQVLATFCSGQCHTLLIETAHTTGKEFYKNFWNKLPLAYCVFNAMMALIVRSSGCDFGDDL